MLSKLMSKSQKGGKLPPPLGETPPAVMRQEHVHQGFQWSQFYSASV